LEVNPAYEKQTGLKAANIIGKRKKENAPASEQRWYDYAIQAAKTGKPLSYEYYNEKVKGYFETQFIPISNNHIAVLFKDVTERKKAEEESSRNSRRITEILESISDDFMVLDHRWIYVYANSQAAKLVGLKPESIVGKNFWDLFPQNRGTHIEQNLRETMEKKEIRRFELYGQYSDRYKLITTYPSVDGIVLIATDITERKLLEQRLKEKDRLAAIGQTAGMVGHDLRNPLQTIVGELFLIQGDIETMPEGQSKASIKESLDSISEQVSYMDKIVSDLQTFVKPVEAQKQMVNIRELTSSTLAQINLPSNIQSSVDIQDHLTVETDPQLLKRVLINLITNSMQALPSGGELVIKSYDDGKGHARILVEDTGEGIPDEVKPKIFTPLFTTKSKGQGFGLAVCKRVIEAQGGTIDFESTVGKGTKFIIELPLK
jgi:PAS domain S-box-containing protein